MQPKHDFDSSPDPKMLAEYSNLFRNLDRAVGSPPNDLLSAVKQLPDYASLPPPVQTWGLLNFVANEDRCNWAGTALLPSLAQDSAVRQALQRGERLGGRVPGHPEWQFTLTDWGNEFDCLVCHPASDETIDLSTPVPFEDTAEVRFGGVSDGYRRAGQLSRLDFGWSGGAPAKNRAIAHWLAERLPMHQAAIRAFYQRWQDEKQRIWLAALLGDWLNAHAAALSHGDAALIAEIEGRVTAWLEQNPWSTFVFRPVNAQCDWRWAMRVLAEHRVAYLDRLIGPNCRKEANGMPMELSLIVDEDLGGWEEDILQWFLSSREPVGADLEAQTAAYLARRHLRMPEVVGALTRHTLSHNEGWGLLAALVVARYEPGRAQGLFAQGLRYPGEATHVQVLAALAVSDWPWADGLLQNALAESKSPITQTACRLALERRKGDEAPAAHPHTEETDQTLLVVNRGPDRDPLRYFGTVEQLFEDNVREVRRCQTIVTGAPTSPPTAASRDLSAEAT